MGQDWVQNCIGLLDTTSAPGSSLKQSMIAFDKNQSGGVGISYATCLQYCNYSQLPNKKNFDFTTFSSAFPSFLLPWLALTAQLPFETGSLRSDFMALSMAVGSPALITYSLALTILNRLWIRHRFGDLGSRARESSAIGRLNWLSGRIRSAGFLLQEGQQVALRTSFENGWLSSLVRLEANQEWWINLEKRLKSSRRGVTFSLIAQVFMAVAALIFTFASAYVGAMGDAGSETQMSSGSLWTWMIPVIIGWILVGTQYSATAVDEALGADKAYLRLDTPAEGLDFVFEKQQGVAVIPDQAQKGHDDQAADDSSQTLPAPLCKSPTFLGFDIGGDEAHRGPIYNYARAFTLWQNTEIIGTSMGDLISSLEPNQSIESPTSTLYINSHTTTTPVPHPPQSSPDLLLTYPPWHTLPTSLWIRISLSTFAALFLQWGTTGPSIFIAYNEPSIGLGCRSFSYLVYGVLSTIVWLCAVLSMLLSHAAMLRHQDAMGSTVLRKDLVSESDKSYRRGDTHTGLCGAGAVLLRITGKGLAVMNMVLLVGSSLLELVGGFDNCWCAGSVLQAGKDAWIVLWMTPEQEDAAKEAGAQGMVMQAVVIVVTLGVFAVVTAGVWRKRGRR